MQSRGSSRTTAEWVESLSQILVPRNTPIFCVYEIVYIYTYMVQNESGLSWNIYRYMNEYLDFSLDFCWTCLAKIYQNLAGYGTEQPNLETGKSVKLDVLSYCKASTKYTD